MSDAPDNPMLGLSDPSRFLLPDEDVGEYQDLLQAYLSDYGARGAHEVRQVELILKCDYDIERQYRMIRAHLDPFTSDTSSASEILSEFHLETLKAVGANSSNTGRGRPQLPAPLEGDTRLTPAVAARYGKWRGLIEVHQRELNFAERRRRRAIELLFTMQDRRRRNATEEAVVVVDPGAE